MDSEADFKKEAYNKGYNDGLLLAKNLVDRISEDFLKDYGSFPALRRTYGNYKTKIKEAISKEII